MTLFRKVFQNQSRPATQDETIDDDALRDAFSAVEQGADPFKLDPLEHAVPQEEHAENEPVDDEAPQGADDDAAVAGEDDMQEALEATDHEVAELIETLNPSDEDEEEPSDPAAPAEISNGPETDEEIAAFMNRALAEEPAPAEEEPDEALSHDMPHTDMGTVDVLEFNSEKEAEDVDVVEMVEDVKEDTPETEVHSVDILEEETPLEVAEAEPEKGSLSQFAQQQMAGLTAPEISREAMAETPASSNNGEVKPTLDLSGGANMEAVPGPAAGRAGRRAGRVKTRLLGFNHGADDGGDPLGQVAENTATPQREKFPVGWLVVVEGPGMGHAFSIFSGASIIGRGEDQMIRLDFGDNSISRHNHAAIAYDEEANKFYVGHGGKSNIIRRNARPVLSTEELHHADLLRIGETTLRFVALCGSDFQWNQAGDSDAADL